MQIFLKSSFRDSCS